MTTPTFASSDSLGFLVFQPEVTATTYNPTGAYLADAMNIVDSYSHTIGAFGGYRKAKIRANTNQAQAENWLFNGLGRHIVVYNPGLATIWEGFVDRVSTNIGGLSERRGSLMEIVNQANAVFAELDTSVDPPIVSPPPFQLIQAVDVTSQSRWGTLAAPGFNPGPGTDEEVTEGVNQYITENAEPKNSGLLSIGNPRTPRVELDCLGYVHWLKTFPYNQTTTGDDYDLSTKISDVLTAQLMPLVNEYSIANNTIQVHQWEDQSRTGWEIIKELTTMGDAADDRYLFNVYNDRNARYEAAPTEDEYYHWVTEGAQSVRDRVGGIVKPWDVRPGKWMSFPDFLIGQVDPTVIYRDPRRKFIESVTFTAPMGLRLEGGNRDTMEQQLAALGLSGMGE